MATAARPSVQVGSGEFRYEVPVGWEQMPEGWTFVEVAGVAVDSADRVFVFSRGEHPVTVFDREGRFLYEWQGVRFARPHGITIAPDDTVFICDDLDHTVRSYTREGKLLLTLGTSGRASDTGATSMDYRTVKRGGPPFHYPTNLALAPSGELYISDGYGNARVHKFTADGRHLLSWGEPGSGPGQFHLPHGIAVDRSGIVYVADRENSRVQLFGPEGDFRGQWTDVARPCQVRLDRADRVYVAELGFHAGQWSGMTVPPGGSGGRVSVFSRQGELLARWGGGKQPCEPGDFFAPHDICVDSHGDVYVGEVVWSAGGRGKLVSPTCHALQKFVLKG
jgi:DNA-binding beta-propeller fold protein YncE